MQKYNYIVLVWYKPQNQSGRWVSAHNKQKIAIKLHTALNKLGKFGWEVTGAGQFRAGEASEIILKRPAN